MKKLKPLAFVPFTVKELKAAGWMRRQLEIQAQGLSGNLDRVWPDVRDSKWIGKDREGWERVPYWLDGFIPLAFLLDDDDMKARAKKYIDAILDNQQKDGWICPCTDDQRARYDVWAVFLICKVLVVYHDCTGDPRIEDAVYRVYKNLYTHIDAHTLFDWAALRWYEAFISIFWLYERRPEEWMLHLCYKLEMQGIDFQKLFDEFRMQQPDPRGVWTFLTHVVNLAMCLKSEALLRRLKSNTDHQFADKALGLLQKYHGMPTGHFTGDECLSGTSPIQGSECCGVVEAMYSYEQLLSLTGESKWGDILDRLTFNALPATLSPDMWTHQYDQLTNQVECTPLPDGVVHFRTNGPESHVFGLEPTYGCCTANFNQGFPKFALSCWMKAPDGFACISAVPAVWDACWEGVPIHCEVESMYPFRDKASIHITVPRAVRFALHLRIPSFAAGACVDGNPAPVGKFYTIEKEWTGRQTVEINFDFEPVIDKRPSGMVCVNRGPLLFSVGIQEKWEKVEYETDGVQRRYPYCDYRLTAQSDWNYALADDQFQLCLHTPGSYVFSLKGAPLGLRAKVVKIDWKMKNGMCTELPDSTQPLSSEMEIELIPYGCTNLRITELPFILLTPKKK